jgi:DNA-directed RNA polymerase specialized sigma24 family protein
MSKATLEKTKTANQGLSPYATPYATKRDFCRIFEKDMNRLYLLSYLLTADHTIAEQCFVGGLHIAQEGNLVFKEWAESWARRTIILNAIRMVRPRLTDGHNGDGSDRTIGSALTERAEIIEIIELPVFERFVFVMSVLERYSVQECALLLGCTRGDVNAARSRALQQVGRSADLRNKLVSIAADQQVQRDGAESELQLGTLSGLAASA